MEQSNLHETLGVPQDADINVIREAYDKLVANPDIQKDAECFKVIEQALEALSHPGKCLAYDAAMQYEPQGAQDNGFNNTVVNHTENYNTGDNNTEANMVNTPNPEMRNYALIAYTIYALGLLIRFAPVIGMIPVYVKRDEAQGSIYASHIDWLIEAFWVSLVDMLFGMLTILILIGWLILVVIGIWFIYRVVVGLTRLSKNKPVPTQG